MLLLRKGWETVGVELLETDTEYELLIWDKGPVLVFQNMICKQHI